jgi:CRP/FNR family transcriptional regulator
MEELSSRLENSESLIEEITLHSVEQRLANFLLAESAGKDEFTLRMTKGDLASQLGMTQETLSRKLAVFQENRMVVLRGQRGIAIANREALEDVAGGGD